MALASGTFDKKNEIRYEVLKTMLCHHTDLSTIKQKHRVFRAWEISLCTSAVSRVLACNAKTLMKLVDHLVEGHANPACDG